MLEPSGPRYPTAPTDENRPAIVRYFRPDLMTMSKYRFQMEADKTSPQRLAEAHSDSSTPHRSYLKTSLFLEINPADFVPQYLSPRNHLTPGWGLLAQQHVLESLMQSTCSLETQQVLTGQKCRLLQPEFLANHQMA